MTGLLREAVLSGARAMSGLGAFGALTGSSFFRESVPVLSGGVLRKGSPCVPWTEQKVVGTLVSVV